MDINEFESRFMNENKDTVNKNALMFNKFVTKPITKEFLNRTFASLDLDDFFEVKKLIPRKSKYKAPEHLIKNLASSELYINKEIPEIAKKTVYKYSRANTQSSKYPLGPAPSERLMEDNSSIWTR